MKKITILFLAVITLSTAFVSCKKDDNNEVKVEGTASADLKIGSAAAVTWTASTVTTLKSGAAYTITAVNSLGTLVIKLENVTAAGTFTLTSATRSATFTSAGKTYTTTNQGGGNVIITSVTDHKIEGTFLCEMFDGTGASAIYAGLNNGKFSATF